MRQKVISFLSTCSDDIKNLCTYLYENPEKREQLSSAASKFTREYNWEKQKQDYYRLIDSLVDR